MRARILTVCAVGLLVGSLAGCGGDKNTSNATGSTTSATQATFVLSEWKVALDGTVKSGPVTVKIDNQGGEKHELVIVAAKDAGALPTKADGSVDEDKIPAKDKVGESGDIDPRSSVTKTFTFAPGTYVAFCNIVEDMGMTGSTMMGGNGPMNGGTTPMGGNGPMNGGTTPMGGNGPMNGGTTPMGGGTMPMGGNGPMNGGTTPMGGGAMPRNSGSTPMGTGPGHVHFALGMSVTFTVS